MVIGVSDSWDTLIYWHLDIMDLTFNDFYFLYHHYRGV